MRTNGKKVLVLLVLLAFVLTALAGCASKQEESDSNTATDQELMVGFIYVGPPGDAGWTYAHDQGRKYLEEKLSYVTTVFQESVNEGADAERALNELAQKGCKVIFATSYGYMDSVIEVAKKYPDVVFMHCSGYKRADNAGTYFGRDYQPRYLSGLVAGKMTTSNQIGYVAAYPIPEVVRCINAFTVGVREVNPDATVKVVWTYTWYDPAKEKQAALSLIEDGCDLITQHQDSYAAQQAAEEKGILSIGCDSDMHSFAPNANLTSPIFNWGDYYVKVVEEVKNGTWKSGDYWGGLEDGVVALAPLSDKVPEDVKQVVAEKEKELIEKKFDVFNGPVKDQEGAVKVPEGQSMSDEDMLSFNWFVEGVLGTIPEQ